MARPLWRLLESEPADGAWNMACDAALLGAVERRLAPPTLRFYGWSEPTVSLGRHQPEPGARARAALAAHGTIWVRRPTGGRAVYHGRIDEELTYAVVASLGEPPFTSGARDAHRRIHAALAAGLARVGVAGELAPRRRSQRPAGGPPARRDLGPISRLACFATSVPDEIVVAGCKLVGSAQRRGRLALLQHGSVPLAGDQVPLREAWPGALPGDAYTTVADAAGGLVSFADLSAALAAGLAAALNVSFEQGVLSESEKEAIAVRIDSLAILDPL